MPYIDIYAGQDAITVLPWVLGRAELLPASSVPGAVGAVVCFSQISNGVASREVIRALPTGFVTAQLMELDLSKDGEIIRFLNTWGSVAAPYAGGMQRTVERLTDPDAERRMLEAAYRRDGAEIPLDPGSIDFEKRGRDIWYAGLNDSFRDAAVASALAGCNWSNTFKSASSSMGGEILNARRYAGGGSGLVSLVYLEEVRQVIAMMQLAVTVVGFSELKGRDPVKVIKAAIELDRRCVESGRGWRPFEDGLSVFSGSWFVDMQREKAMPMDAVRVVWERQFETIEANLMAFCDRCLTSTAAPVIAHSGLRRGSLRGATFPATDPDAPSGNLLFAMAAQLYAYICDGNPWRTCEICGRPYKYEQQVMAPICNPAKAEKEYSCRHSATKTLCCSKRHETQWRRERDRERAAERAARERSMVR